MSTKASAAPLKEQLIDWLYDSRNFAVLTFFQGMIIITFINYVPVDWRSYMEQVDIHVK